MTKQEKVSSLHFVNSVIRIVFVRFVTQTEKKTLCKKSSNLLTPVHSEQQNVQQSGIYNVL